MLKIYVDDVNGVYNPVKVGMEYSNGELIFNETKAINDKDVPEDERTMALVKDIANSVDDMIKMTIDTPSKHEDNKVPMLDLKVWIEPTDNNNIYYKFYEKPTKNTLVISKTSAMPKSKKFDTLSQEVFRRLHNTKEEIDWTIKVGILEKFMSELKASGYNEHDRYEILKSGMNRYNSLKKMEEEGIRPFYRNKFFQRNERDQKRHEK